jgi:hypothetical protein
MRDKNVARTAALSAPITFLTILELFNLHPVSLSPDFVEMDMQKPSVVSSPSQNLIRCRHSPESLVQVLSR